MYYPSSENKGADQLRGYREADLRLCFRLCRLLVFPRGGSFMGKFEKHFLDSCGVHALLWLRFLGDIFVVWGDSEEKFLPLLKNCINVMKP